MSATTTNTARNTTPQVITDPKFVSSRTKRNGLWKPAVASNINKHRPMMTTIGAMRRPTRMRRLQSG